MKYPRILAALRSAQWAISESTLQAIGDTLAARMTGRLSASSSELPAPRAFMDEDDGDGDAPTEPPYEMAAPGVAVVKLHGIIGKNLSSMEMMCGGCDIVDVHERLVAAAAAAEVGAIILDIDSPGGVASGVAEFATAIEQLSEESGKPIIAYASGLCASAAYWIACGCDAIYSSPSSDVGSIGVYMALVDESENWAKEGYRLVLVKAGEHKGAGMSGSKITPEQEALWQSKVDYIYSQFTAAVRAARPSVADTTMQGQTFYGPLAQEVKLVDGIHPDVASVASEISSFWAMKPAV